MAKKKNRKLFLMLASETNKTLDCSYNCYEEPPRYYATSPQQPPWSSPQPITAPSPSVSPVYQEPQSPSSSFDAIIIIAITGAALFILLTGFFLVAKFVSESVNRETYQFQRDNSNHNTVEEEFQDRDQMDNPIWLIRTTGLQQSIINSITICNYKRGDGLIERTDCPVCLSEFEEEERLRLLPKCNHAFHISCIDTWLKSHTNCPLCRAAIAINATPRCSGLVDETPGGSGSGSRFENRAQIENRAESVRESNDESETETKEKDRVLGNCIDPNEEDSINSFSHAKTHIEMVDFPGKSCVNQTRDFTKQEKEKEESRAIGDEASCSGSHNFQSCRSSGSFGSGESNGEANEDTETTDSGISSNTLNTIGSSSSVSWLNKNKSSVFPW